MEATRSRAELRLFRYALAVAEHGNFTAAAKALHIAQPPLSQQIRRLERMLGLALFARGRHGARPTPAGALFLDRARTALVQAERAMETGRRAGRGEAGHLVIGLAGGAMFSFLPGLIRGFRSAFPAVSLAFHNIEPERQLAMIAEGELDLGFTRLAPAPPGVTLELMSAERFVAALPSGSVPAGRRQLALRDLAAEPFVLFPRTPGGGFHQEVVALCLAAGFAPRIAQEVAPMHAVIGLVGAGLGVAVVPASVQALRLPEVTYRPLRGLAQMSRLFLAAPETPTSAAAERFIALCRASAASRRTGAG